jgi:hypothetical protein
VVEITRVSDDQLDLDNQINQQLWDGFLMDEEQGNLEEHGNSSEKTKRIIRSDISPNAMDSGRDEMNLVEFPLAGLSDRVPTGRNSLVFEDTIWDRSRGENVRRRLTIAGSAEYGLPVALDDEVMLGLIQVSKANRFESRCVAFRPAELIRLLGWRPEGRSYDRLEKSLRKWLAVTLYYDNAWWDKQRKAWVDEHFHLIDNRGGCRAGSCLVLCLERDRVPEFPGGLSEAARHEDVPKSEVACGEAPLPVPRQAVSLLERPSVRFEDVCLRAHWLQPGL